MINRNHTIMRTLLATIFSFFVFFNTISAQKQFIVDPNVRMREINLSFTQIKVSNGIRLYLSQADKEQVAVSAVGEKDFAGIKTEVIDKTLHIYFASDKGWQKRSNQLKVYLAFKTLESIEITASAEVQVVGKIDVPDLIIKQSGSAIFQGDITVNQLRMNQTGSSDARISGFAGSIIVLNTGASDLQAYGLQTNSANISVSGASDVFIAVEQELRVVATGASDVSYRGNPKILHQQICTSCALEQKKPD